MLILQYLPSHNGIGFVFVRGWIGVDAGWCRIEFVESFRIQKQLSVWHLPVQAQLLYIIIFINVGLQVINYNMYQLCNL